MSEPVLRDLETEKSRGERGGRRPLQIRLNLVGSSHRPMIMEQARERCLGGSAGCKLCSSSSWDLGWSRSVRPERVTV